MDFLQQLWTDPLTTLQGLVAVYGVAAIAVSLFFDELGAVFLPSTVIMMSMVALMGKTGQPFPYDMMAVALLVPPISNSLLFALGRTKGYKWVHKYGHTLPILGSLLTAENLEKGEAKFRSWGPWAVLLFSMTSGFRPIVSFLSGTMHLSFFRFLGSSFLGILVWATGSVVGTYFFAGNYQMILLWLVPCVALLYSPPILSWMVMLAVNRTIVKQRVWG